MALDLGARTMAEFATVLQQHAGRLVQDETGLVGRFDIHVGFSVALAPTDRALAFEALEQQLGLRLEPRRGSLRMIVIEHAEWPISESEK